MKKKATLSITFIVVALLLMATTSVGFVQPDYTIMTAKTADLGEFLVDGQGRTLYYFIKDAPGVSSTTGPVAVNWPSFYAEKIEVPSNLNSSDFGTITRADGKKQTTFKGWPLYYFIKDMATGDIKGQKVNNVWFVVNVN
jgi:predicted lipoprotein with Yx(FWY)xxD motif